MGEILNNGEFDNIDFNKLDITNIVNLCLRCKTKEDAEKVLRRYEKYCATPEIAHNNLGYIFGYCGPENRKRLYSLFSVNHPIFGEGFGRGVDISGEDAFKMGKKMGEEIRKDIEKKCGKRG